MGRHAMREQVAAEHKGGGYLVVDMSPVKISPASSFTMYPVPLDDVYRNKKPLICTEKGPFPSDSTSIICANMVPTRPRAVCLLLVQSTLPSAPRLTSSKLLTVDIFAEAANLSPSKMLARKLTKYLFSSK